MKLSLLWLADHLDAGCDVDTVLACAPDIVRRLGESTVEIEQYESLSYDLTCYTMARYEKREGEMDVLYSIEDQRVYHIAVRSGPTVGAWYLIYRAEHAEPRYATVGDMNGGQGTLLPAYYVTDITAHGSWKSRCEPSDVRFSIDNKAITHRADLWSHRGFAREIACLMGWRLRDVTELINDDQAMTVQHQQHNVEVLQSAACRQFATTHLAVYPKMGSIPWMTLRLARIDSRPLSGLVDCTNYTMFDMGQPLHVFDADQVEGSVRVRSAKSGEKLRLLDGATCTLTISDCVVADERGPLSLAGIKGGESSGVSGSTSHIILEGAHFSSDAIRHGVRTHGLRTDASVRAEKGVDGAQLLFGLKRFCTLVLNEQLIAPQACTIMMIGKEPGRPQPIALTHAFIERKIGNTVEPASVIRGLHGIGCTVECQEGAYRVTPPSWRITDLRIPEDIVEEVARIIGYATLQQRLPQRITGLTQAVGVQMTRAVKRHLAYGLHLYEVVHYPFYDEEFLQRMNLTIEGAAELKNPVSLQWRRLITSLLVQLVKDVHVNSVDEKSVRLFEIGTTWNLHADRSLVERKSLAFVLYHAEQPFTFYSGKTVLLSLFELLSIHISWTIPSKPLEPWWDVTQCAVLEHNKIPIGTAGMIAASWCTGLSSTIFAAELDFDYLMRYKPPQRAYKAQAKYPSIKMDVSLLVDSTCTVEQLERVIVSVDERIERVELIDMFSKPEWHGQRSLTFRYTCTDHTRTMTRHDAEMIMQQVHKSMEEHGAKVR